MTASGRARYCGDSKDAYAILSTAVPPARMGVYMGVFNFFIVIPEIIASLGFGPLTRADFGRDNP